MPAAGDPNPPLPLPPIAYHAPYRVPSWSSRATVFRDFGDWVMLFQLRWQANFWSSRLLC